MTENLSENPMLSDLDDRSIQAERDVVITGTVITGDIGGDVHIHETKVDIPPPPEPARPPDTTGFVGREQELAHYERILNSGNSTVIAGMVGMGKSTLAARLAQKIAEPDRLFWHTFHEGESIQAVVWKMAGFLAWHGEDGLWQMMQHAQLSGGQPPPPEVLFDYLYQLIRGKGYVLCFDDFEHVDDDPLVGQLADRLRQEVVAGEFRLIITSRRVPDFFELAEYEPLAGLNDQDMRMLLAERGVELDAKRTAELHTRTEGNAELLTLAVQALKRSRRPERVIGRLVEADNIERFLMNEVDESLGQDEREAMNGVSALLGYPGTRDAIEVALDSGSIRRQLSYLTNRHLLSVSETEFEREYVQHAIVQAFYYDLLGRRERREMHGRAGEFYEFEEPELLKAALHYERADAWERSAELATDDIWGIINRGQGQGLLALLQRFKANQLSSVTWAKVQGALGEILVMIGDGSAARSYFQTALEALEAESPSTAVAIISARVCRGMGEALRHSAPAEAVTWFERGLQMLDGQSPMEEAAMYVKLGHARYTLGEFELAVEASQQALACLPRIPHPLRASALLNLGIVHGTQGNLDQALNCYGEALNLGDELHDLWTVAKAWHNIGVENEIAGKWDAAFEAYQHGLKAAEQLGSQAQKATLELSSGILAMKKGDYDRAELHLDRCLTLARNYDLGDYVVGATASLADLHLRRGEVNATAPLLVEAEQRALATASRWQLPEIYRLRGEWHLLRDEPLPALEWADQALALAEELELPVEVGVAWRVQGLAQAALGEDPGASFQRSLDLLREHEPYEAERTEAVWVTILPPSTSQEEK